MLASFYHCNQKPWVYQVEENKIVIQFKIAKNLLEKATILVSDFLLQNDYGNYHDYNLEQEIFMEKIAETEFDEYWSCKLKLFTNRYRYLFKLQTRNEKVYYFGQNGTILKPNILKFGFTYYFNKDNFMDTPNWYRFQNFYKISPYSFNLITKKSSQKTKTKTSNGNLKLIINNLNYIKSLGFNAIHLTSIFSKKTMNDNDIVNHLQIDSRLGNENDLKSLINKCHKLNLKIILSISLSHISVFSKPWQDVIKNKQTSTFKNWFLINNFKAISDDVITFNPVSFSQIYPYQTFGFNSDMPLLNLDNKDVKKYLFDAVEKWTKFGIDGWFIDDSTYLNYSFCQELKKNVKKINSEIVLVGNVSHDAINLLESNIFDSLTNYCLKDIILNYVLSSKTLKDKIVFIEQYNNLSLKYTPEQQWAMMNALSSNDNNRLFSLVEKSPKSFELAFKIMFYNPGIVNVFYGDEVGLYNSKDVNSSLSMPSNKKTFNFKDLFKKLNHQKLKLVTLANIYDQTYAKLDDDSRILLINPKYFVIITEDNCFLELWNDNQPMCDFKDLLTDKDD